MVVQRVRCEQLNFGAHPLPVAANKSTEEALERHDPAVGQVDRAPNLSQATLAQPLLQVVSTEACSGVNRHARPASERSSRIGGRDTRPPTLLSAVGSTNLSGGAALRADIFLATAPDKKKTARISAGGL